MKSKRYGLIKLFFVIIMASPCHVGFARSMSPELEIKKTLMELDEWKGRLESEAQLFKKPQIGNLKVSLLQHFQNAQENFKQREWNATIRNLNSFLNDSQSLNSKSYLETQYLLGYSYQEIGYDQNAIRAYLRFLAAFITEQDFSNDKFQSVIHRLIELHSNLSDRDLSRLKELISALASLNLPMQLKSEVIFFNALLASKGQVQSYSHEWFQEAMKISSDPRLSAQSLFFQGILYLNQAKYAQGEAKFKAILNLPSDKIVDLQNLARINLARLAAHQKKTQTALSYYLTIPSDTTLYREALNEQIYLHLDRQEFGEAEVKTKVLMERFPDSKEVQQLRSRLAYLNLKAGHFDQAKVNIEKTGIALRALKDWIHEHYPEDRPVNHEQLRLLKKKVQPFMNLPPLLNRALGFYDRLTQISSRLSDLRAEVRSLVLALGRLNLEQYDPTWNRRTNQIDQSVKQILALGNRLVTLEKNFYGDRLTKLDQISLERSLKRRERKEGPSLQFKQQRGNPASWIKLANVNETLAQIHEKLFLQLATVNGLLFSTKRNANLSQEYTDRLEYQKNRVGRMITAVNRAIEIVRSRRVRDLLNQSPHHATRNFLLSFAQSLYEESLILQEIRDHYHLPSQVHMAEEVNLAWQKWEYLIKFLLEEINQMQSSMKKKLEHDLTEMERYIQTYDQMSYQIEALNQSLAMMVGQTMPTNRRHFDNWIEVSEARLWKWEADLSWISYLDQSDQRRQAESDFKVEGMMIRENLRDLE